MSVGPPESYPRHKPHAPSDYQRNRVKLLSSNGVRHEDIALIVGIDAKTLRKHYREELDVSKAEANAEVCGHHMKLIRAGNATAVIWWMKIHMGYTETGRVEVTGRDGGPIEYRDVGTLTDDQLLAVINAASSGDGVDEAPEVTPALN